MNITFYNFICEHANVGAGNPQKNSHDQIQPEVWRMCRASLSSIRRIMEIPCLSFICSALLFSKFKQPNLTHSTASNMHTLDKYEKGKMNLPTWVMTHCTLCRSSWTDISSSLIQHSISGCGSHPLSFCFYLFFPLSLRSHTSSPYPSFPEGLPTFCNLFLGIPFPKNVFSLPLLLEFFFFAIFSWYFIEEFLLSFITAPLPNKHKAWGW